MSVCLCERMSKRPPLRRHCCVFFCLEPRGRSLKSSLSCATNILAATVSQQQDVFPERKRGWEERPNVDLFLLLSFLFWLSRSCRTVWAQLYFSHCFKVFHCLFAGLVFCDQIELDFGWRLLLLPSFSSLGLHSPSYGRAPKDLGYFLFPNFNKQLTSVSAKARRREGTQIETRWLWNLKFGIEA